MRRARAPKRKIAPDPKFNNPLIGKFVNYLMERGKKTIALTIIYDAFEEVKNVTKQEPLDVFDLALNNVGPALEIKSKRIGGANYQIPVEVRGDRKATMAMRWIIEAARSKSGKPMAKRLAEEIIDASKGQGSAMKKKDDTLRMAEANKAFAHYA
jgi:small subunit ribosomal protein S7